jgi:hypothetical protein
MPDRRRIDWKPNFSWAVLALLTAVVAWRLTHIITHVDPSAMSTVTLSVDEQPPLSLTTRSSLATLQQARFQIPALVITGYKEALLVVTAPMRSLAVDKRNVANVSCGVSDHVFERASLTFLADAAKEESFKPLPVSPDAVHGTSVPVPSSLRAALAKVPKAQGVIRCVFSAPLAAAPTYTDRSLTLRLRNTAGAVILDVSGLEDIDDARFSGGVTVPFAGDRVRLLDGSENIVSVDWVDVAASERRDIVLVLIGALAAIGAAMAIEAIRPLIERDRG